MADNPRHGFTSPQLHRLHSSFGPFYILNRNNLMQNILGVSLGQGKGNPALSVQENASQSPPHSVNSNTGTANEKDPRKRKFSLTVGLVSVAAATAVAPVERVYILMQCQNEMMKAGRVSSPYKGIKDCLLRTIKHEGAISLWRGNSANVIRFFATGGLPLAFLQVPLQSSMPKKTNKSPSFWVLPSAVMLFKLCSYPLDYARVRLANDVKADRQLQFSLDSSVESLKNVGGSRQFRGVFDVFKKTLQSDGIIGLYRGYIFTCIGFFAFSRADKWVKMQYLEENTKQKKMTIPAFLAFLVTISSLTFAHYPVLTVSRRMMMTSGEVKKYKGAVHAFNQIVEHEGVSSLYKGVSGYALHCVAHQVAVVGLMLGLRKLSS